MKTLLMKLLERMKTIFYLLSDEVASEKKFRAYLMKKYSK